MLHPAAAGLELHDPGVAVPHGPGFSTRVTVLGGGAPIAGGRVQLFGRIWSTVASPISTAQSSLAIYGEAPDTNHGPARAARADYWSRWVRRPTIAPDANHAVELTPLTNRSAMRCRREGSAGAARHGPRSVARDVARPRRQVALVDSAWRRAIASSAGITRGIDIVGRSERGWQSDETGHGSHGAGIIAVSGLVSGPVAGPTDRAARASPCAALRPTPRSMCAGSSPAGGSAI